MKGFGVFGDVDLQLDEAIRRNRLQHRHFLRLHQLVASPRQVEKTVGSVLNAELSYAVGNLGKKKRRKDEKQGRRKGRMKKRRKEE